MGNPHLTLGIGGRDYEHEGREFFVGRFDADLVHALAELGWIANGDDYADGCPQGLIPKLETLMLGEGGGQLLVLAGEEFVVAIFIVVGCDEGAEFEAGRNLDDDGGF